MSIAYKKIRYSLLLISALFSRYYGYILLGIVAGILSFVLVPRLAPHIPSFRPTYRIGIVGRFTLSELPVFIQRQISLGLTSITESGLPAPSLASAWESTDSGKRFIFTLKPDLKWQNGSRFVAKDIQYQFRDAKISYPDENHLVIDLPDIYSPLPVLTSRPIFKSKLLGLGSYRVTKIKRNGDYIESLSISPNSKTLTSPNIQYIFYANEAMARTAFKLGNIRTIMDIQKLEDLANWPNVEVLPIVHKDRYVAIFFNVTDPMYSGASGKNLRQAIAYTIDKSRWTKDQRALGSINPNSWAYNSSLKTYDQDLIKAKQLLAKVEKIPSDIIIHTLPAYLGTAEQIQVDLEKLGIDSTVSVTPDIPSEYSTLILAQAIPPDPDQYHLWHSTQPTNITQIKNPRIDKLLEDGRKSLDTKERKAIYLEFQKYLVEETPTVFLFHPTSYTITEK